MKHTLILTLLLILTSTACQHRTPITSVFAEAESLMYIHPDSALKLLQAIPTPERLSGKEQADYALLLTQAKSRNQIYATSDSLIRIAVDYYQKAIYINRLYGFTERLVSNIMNILNLPIKGPTDSITLYIKELEESLNTVSKKLQFQSYNNIGVYYKENKKLRQAESYFIKAIQIADETPYRSYKNLADIYIAQGKEHQADSLYNEALKSPVWATQAKVYENIYKRKLNLGLTEEATHYINQYVLAVDSFYSNREASQIQEIQQKYDQEVILRQKVQIEIWLYRIVFSFILIITITLIVAWNLDKKRQKQMLALQERISKITVSSEADKTEITKLNEMLIQNKLFKQAIQLSTLEDIQALEFYLRLLQSPLTYNPKNDLPLLQHWLNLAYNNFAIRWRNTYPNLTSTEIT